MLAPVARWIRTLPARYGRRTLIALALIAALGLVFRAVAVVHPVADPADDSHAYYALAKSLYEEGSYGGPEFHAEASSDGLPALLGSTPGSSSSRAARAKARSASSRR